jgi:hypothetical protein
LRRLAAVERETGWLAGTDAECDAAADVTLPAGEIPQAARRRPHSTRAASQDTDLTRPEGLSSGTDRR